MRVLITGGGGQLGRALERVLGDDAVALARGRLDVTDARSVDAALREHRPEVVVHCAALTDTARCEREPKLADEINAAGSEHVARACASAGARLVMISTNEVFDGEATTPYAEDAEANPINAYGRSKLRGEQRALAACADTLVARTSWLYGEPGENFVARVRRAARGGGALRFVSDEIASPTAAADLAVTLHALLEAGAPTGVYHLAGEGEASRYEWACEITRLSGLAGAQIEAVTTSALRAAGYDGPRKPRYSVLANTRARSLGVVLPDWRDALRAYIARAGVAADG